MFLLKKRNWKAAVVQQFETWESDEKAIFKSYKNGCTVEGLKETLDYYRIARNFPLTKRQSLIKIINDVSLEGADNAEKFFSFVRSVRDIANSYSSSSRGKRKSNRPFSGVSKLLWHRFPLNGFIYDSQVCHALLANGLVTPFYAELKSCGGRPSDERERTFLIAATGYAKFALPLYKPLKQALEAAGLDGDRAARIVDKIFWLEGLPKKKREKEIEALCARARPVMNEIAAQGRKAARHLL